MSSSHNGSKHAVETSSTLTVRGKFSIRKKVVFSLTATVAFFLVLEVLLAVCGVQPTLYFDDPYVGFSSYVPLFVEKTNPGDATSLVTARNQLRRFNQQSFPKQKPPETYRIFCVGGSTTYGRPYDDVTSFSGWLRELLRAADDSRQWEVVNAGGISYASYRVAKLMEELIRYEPDLFIVYSGHNEFLERRTYGSLLKMPTAARGLVAALSETRTYTVLQRLVRSRTASPSGQPSNRFELAGEVETMLENSIGPEAYRRDDKLQGQVLRHYRFNLSRMVAIARSAGSEVILVTPAWNLKDSSPFKSEHRDGLSETELLRFEQLIGQAQRSSERSLLTESLAALDEAVTIDDRFANLHYQRGRVLFELKRFSEAKTAFTQASDEDVCPLRALTTMMGIVSEVSAENSISHVNFMSVVEQHSEHGIPGENLFLDHVHPTIDGNRILARVLIDKLVSLGVVQPMPSWGDKEIERIAGEVEGRLDRRQHGLALRNLSKVLGWAGKLDEADTLALRALELTPHDADTLYRAANAYFRRGDLQQAEARYSQSLDHRPDSAKAYYGLGLVASERNQLD